MSLLYPDRTSKDFTHQIFLLYFLTSSAFGLFGLFIVRMYANAIFEEQQSGFVQEFCQTSIIII